MKRKQDDRNLESRIVWAIVFALLFGFVLLYKIRQDKADQEYQSQWDRSHLVSQ